ncbi:hypothetical protein Tco_0771744 [Tanacetum coccineum]|uniref:Uncharacterized protein n=1 Tax=Tanacetum coccineum TaxID=301880 RepID=A0ABQ4ZJY5_9ASTR
MPLYEACSEQEFEHACFRQGLEELQIRSSSWIHVIWFDPQFVGGSFAVRGNVNSRLVTPNQKYYEVLAVNLLPLLRMNMQMGDDVFVANREGSPIHQLHIDLELGFTNVKGHITAEPSERSLRRLRRQVEELVFLGHVSFEPSTRFTVEVLVSLALDPWMDYKWTSLNLGEPVSRNGPNRIAYVLTRVGTSLENYERELHGEGHVGMTDMRTLKLLLQAILFSGPIYEESSGCLLRWCQLYAKFQWGQLLSRFLVGDHVKAWDQKLCQAEFAHNHAVNRSIGFSPFQKVQDFVEGLHEVHKAVRDNLHLLPYHGDSSDDDPVVNSRANFVYPGENDAGPSIEEREYFILEARIGPEERPFHSISPSIGTNPEGGIRFLFIPSTLMSSVTNISLRNSVLFLFFSSAVNQKVASSGGGGRPSLFAWLRTHWNFAIKLCNNTSYDLPDFFDARA